METHNKERSDKLLEFNPFRHIANNWVFLLLSPIIEIIYREIIKEKPNKLYANVKRISIIAHHDWNTTRIWDCDGIIEYGKH